VLGSGAARVFDERLRDSELACIERGGRGTVAICSTGAAAGRVTPPPPARGYVRKRTDARLLREYNSTRVGNRANGSNKDHT